MLAAGLVGAYKLHVVEAPKAKAACEAQGGKLIGARDPAYVCIIESRNSPKK